MKKPLSYDEFLEIRETVLRGRKPLDVGLVCSNWLPRLIITLDVYMREPELFNGEK